MASHLPLSPAVVDMNNPWPGLGAFEESAKDFFRGRDAEAAELTRLVGEAALTVLFGKSGLGKTSLLNAGLFPRLRGQNFLPVYVRLDVRDRSAPILEQAAAALAAEIRDRSVEEIAPSDGRSLWERLHGRTVRWWSRRNQPLTPLFVFDQFEEVFTLGAENPSGVERLRLDLADLIENRIPDAVAAAMEGDGSAEQLDLRSQRYKVLLSLREDFLPELEGWKGDMPSLMRNRLRLVPMNADRAMQVVLGETGTGRTHQLVTPETAREIVRFVGAVDPSAESRGDEQRRAAADRPWETLDIEPALLSLVCEGLNDTRKRRGDAAIDAALLKEKGRTIIGDFYDRVMVDVPAGTRQFIEDQLITEGGFRNSFPLKDALDRRLLTEELLRRLVDRRLLRIEHQLGADRIELTHDRLTDVVREHRDWERQRVQLEKQRRFRWMAAAVLIVLMAVSGVFAYLWNNARIATAAAVAAEKRAQGAFREALAPKLATRSRYILDGVRNGSTETALLLSAAAYRAQPGNDSYIGLRYALESTHDLSKVLVLPDPVVALSPDGLVAVTARWNELSLWDTATGLRRGKPLSSVSVGSPRAVFSPLGTLLATIGVDDPVPVRIWDTATGEPVAGERIGTGHSGYVTTAGFSVDGKTIATGAEDGTIRLWDLTSGDLRSQLRGAAVTVRSVAFNEDGSGIVSAGDDGSVIVWDVATGSPRLGPLRRGASPMVAAEFSRDGSLVLARGRDSRLQVWNLAAGGSLQLDFAFPRPPGAAAINPFQTIDAATFGPGADGTAVVVATADATVHVLDSRNGQDNSRSIQKHVSPVTAMVVNRKSAVVTASADGSVRTWPIYDIVGIGLVRMPPGNCRIGDDFTLAQCPSERGRGIEEARFAFSDDRKKLVGGTGQSLRVWDSPEPDESRELARSGGGSITSIAASGDGTQVILGTAEGMLTTIDAATGTTRLAPWKAFDAPVHTLAVSADGRFAASLSGDSILLWDLGSGTPQNRPLAGRSRATSAAFSPDGRRLVLGWNIVFAPGASQEPVSLGMWDTSTGERLSGGFDKYSNPVSAVAFSADGALLAAAGQGDGRIWDMKSDGKESRTLIGLKEASAIAKLVFSPGNDTVAAFSFDSTVGFWDVATGEPLGVPFRGSPNDLMPAMNFTADGKSLRVVYRDAMLQIFPAPPTWIDNVCAKVVRNLSRAEWKEYVGDTDYVAQCPACRFRPIEGAEAGVNVVFGTNVMVDP